MAAVRLRVDRSPELERIISKCLEPDRDRRYQHASELRADLQRLEGTSTRDVLPAAMRDPPAVRRSTRWIVVPAAAAALALSVAGYVYVRRPPPLTDKDTIVLADFTNRTGDPVFDETLRQGLAVQLEQSPFLSLVSDERIRKTLPLMNQPANARLTFEVAQGVCVRTGSAAVLEGSIATSRQPVRPRTARDELRHRRRSRQRAGAGGAQGRGPRRAESDCETVPDARGGIARHHRATLDAARRSDDAVARSLEGLQHRDAKRSSRPASPERSRCSSVRSRSTRTLRSPMPISGSLTPLSQSGRWRGRARSRRTSCAIGPAISSGSGLKRCTTGRSPAIWNGSSRRWQPGRRPTRATGVLAECWAASPPGALAITSWRSTPPLRPSLSIQTKRPLMATRPFGELHLNRLADAEASVRRAIERKLDIPDFFVVPVLHRVLERGCRGDQTEGGTGQGKALHARHDVAPGGARTGSPRPIAGRQTGVRGRGRNRDAAGPARTGGGVRSGNCGVGSVLRESGGSETEGHRGPRARHWPRRGLCGRVRAGPLGRCGSVPGSRG